VGTLTIDHKGAIFVGMTSVLMFVGDLSTICENGEPHRSLDRICTSCRKFYFSSPGIINPEYGHVLHDDGIRVCVQVDPI